MTPTQIDGHESIGFVDFRWEDVDFRWEDAVSDELFRQLKTQEAESDDLPSLFGPTPFVRPVALDEATVALVTSAGLHTVGQERWTDQDQSFRVIDRRERNLRIGHRSANFDRAGFSADINVVLPLDRLEELAQRHIVGAAAPRHVSFMGALRGNLSTIRMDSGPAAAKLLRDDGVNVVLLTPV